MTTRQQTADAFATGRAAHCRNATATATTYRLHGHAIATRDATGAVHFDWCGWFTPTTAAHMNAVLRALGEPFRVSYAQARDGKAPAVFTVNPQPMQRAA
jgi:hypothetical protein